MKYLVLIFALLIAACVPIQSDGESEAALKEQEKVEVVNVASWGLIKVSNGAWNKLFAVDGDSETWWSADDFAPQWLEIKLDDSYLVERVEVSMSQVRPGPTTHEIILKDGEGDILFTQRISSSMTSDRDTITLEVDPPQRVAGVQIKAVRHEGWVAYREVRLFARVHPFSMGLSRSVRVRGLGQPVYLTHAGDGSGRLFVLERVGRIRIVKEGALLESPFLDISHMLSTYGFHGLLGLAFPADYAERGQFYVTYISADSQNVVSRFTVSPDPDKADHDSEEVLLSFNQPGAVHSVGTIAFGPHDGYLYIGVGDGGTLNDNGKAAQETASLLGKILRIDVSSTPQSYTIPPDNPFVGLTGHAPEIWALGLRNPWGFAFDRRTGDLYIPDTGLITREEVNYQSAASGGGENYGWPHWEGELCGEACELENLIFPVTTYETHSKGYGCAVVGGAVYDGRFIYADFCTGGIWSLGKQDHSGWEAEFVARMGVPISSLGVNEAGLLYAVGYETGNVYWLVKNR